MRYQYQGEIIGEASRVRIDSRDSWTWNGRHAPRVRVGVPLIRRTRRERRAPLARPIINRNYYYPRSPPAIRYPAAAAAFCSLSLSLSLARARARTLLYETFTTSSRDFLFPKKALNEFNSWAAAFYDATRLCGGFPFAGSKIDGEMSLSSISRRTSSDRDGLNPRGKISIARPRRGLGFTFGQAQFPIALKAEALSFRYMLSFIYLYCGLHAMTVH